MIYIVTEGFYAIIQGVYTDKKQAKAKIAEILEATRNPEHLCVWAYPPNSTDHKWFKEFK